MQTAQDDPRILFLEDEPVVALDAVMDLKDNGFENVTHVATLRDAEAEIRDHEFDVAILDININGMSSLPLARRLRDAGIPVIFASGYRPDDEAIADIANAFVPKPYSTRRLIRSIKLVGV